MPRLDYLDGGVRYRLPPPGVIVRDGRVTANVAYPGFDIRYTVDGAEPDATSTQYRVPISVAPKLKLKAFDTRGRGSRTTRVDAPSGESLRSR